MNHDKHKRRMGRKGCLHCYYDCKLVIFLVNISLILFNIFIASLTSNFQTATSHPPRLLCLRFRDLIWLRRTTPPPPPPRQISNHMSATAAPALLKEINHPLPTVSVGVSSSSPPLMKLNILILTRLPRLHHQCAVPFLCARRKRGRDIDEESAYELPKPDG
jgi:hypothetical protein